MKNTFQAVMLDRIYHLRLTHSAIIEFEQLTGWKLMDFSAERGDMLTHLLWIMMLQENSALTHEKAMKIVNKSGRAQEIFEAAIMAIFGAFPDRKTEAAEKIEPVFIDYTRDHTLAISELKMNSKEFWSLTPAEFSAIVDRYVKEKKNQYNDRMAQAWHTAYFNLARQGDHMVSLKEHLIDTDAAPQRRQTDNEMLNMCKMLNAAYGGEVVEA